MNAEKTPAPARAAVLGGRHLIRSPAIVTEARAGPANFREQHAATDFGRSQQIKRTSLLDDDDPEPTRRNRRRLSHECSQAKIGEPMKRPSADSGLSETDPDVKPLANGCQDQLHQSSRVLKQINSKQESAPYAEIQASSDRHLVKTVEDLPVFVTIEGYRVASYIIDGEPFLCLPHLLHFIQQKHPLDKVIEIFEQTAVSFVSATPKQLEGFVKAIVLPAEAKSPPLIRRSDAERVCLALFDQCSKAVVRGEDLKRNKEPDCNTKSKGLSFDGHKLSMQQDVTDDGKQKEQPLFDQDISFETDKSFLRKKSLLNGRLAGNQKDSKNENLSPCYQNVLNLTLTQDKIIRSDCSNFSLGRSSNEDLEITKSHVNRPEPVPEAKVSKKDSKLTSAGLDMNEETNTTNVNEHKQESEKDTLLFESEAQHQILNLARAATSTLIIQVYHRCFGKCRGLYYPSLLNLTDPDGGCIECASCHRLLTPRRFIGHTHGTKETNVCHWGFNSYHWRSYIQLSKTQSMNNLDEDELIVQLKLLRGFENDADPDADEDADGGVKSLPAPGQQSPKIVRPHHACSASDRRMSQEHNEQNLHQKLQDCNAVQRPLGSNWSRSLDRSSSKSAHSKQKPMTFSDQKPSTSSSGGQTTTPSLFSNLTNYYADFDGNAHAWLMMGGAHSMSLPMAGNLLAASQQHQLNLTSSDQNTLVNQMNINSAPNLNQHLHTATAQSSNHGFLPPTGRSHSVQSSPAAVGCQRLLQNHQLNQQILTYSSLLRPAFPEHQQKMNKLASPSSVGAVAAAATLSTESTRSVLASEKLIKQDLFVSTAMESYLETRGLHPQLTKEITETCLELIQRSRALF